MLLTPMYHGFALTQLHVPQLLSAPPIITMISLGISEDF